MAVFGVEVIDNIESKEFMAKSKKRMENPNFAINPFDGDIIRIREDLPNANYIVIMKPIYPRIYLVGLFLMAVTLLFTGLKFNWFLLPGILLFMTGVFWSRYFYFVSLYIGLRKVKYKGLIKLSSSDTIVSLLYQK